MINYLMLTLLGLLPTDARASSTITAGLVAMSLLRSVHY